MKGGPHCGSPFLYPYLFVFLRVLSVLVVKKISCKKSLHLNMKKLLLLFFILSISCSTFAQDKYKKIFYKDQSIENMDVKITLTDAVAVPGGLKFRLTITNKTTDYILFKPTECEFRTKSGNMKPVEKSLMIKPMNKEAIVLDMKAPQNMVTDDFRFMMDGFYRIGLDGRSIPVAEFKLPATVNDFKAEDFTVKLDKVKKETASSYVKFIVAYTGKGIGIIDQKKITVKMPDGKEYANYNDDRPLIMEPGTSDNFASGWKDLPAAAGDMQKVEMLVQFNEVFRETIPVKIPSLELRVLFDEPASNEKGK